MQMIYYTVAGLLLYLVSDWLLQRAELRYGRRFENRNLYFFLILSTLALASFAVIRTMSVA